MTETLLIDDNSYYRMNEYGWILGILNDDTAWIAAFMVHSSERGEGHGSDFLSNFEDWSNTHAMSKITVILKSELLTDEPTMNFFQHRGYVQDTVLKTFLTKEIIKTC